jgi:hypothetical protein
MAHSIWEALGTSRDGSLTTEAITAEAVTAVRDEAYGTRLDLADGYDTRRQVIDRRLQVIRRMARHGEDLVAEQFIGVVMGARAFSEGLFLMENRIDSSGFHFTPQEFECLVDGAEEGADVAREGGLTMFTPLDRLLSRQPITGFNGALEYAKLAGFGVGVRSAEPELKRMFI